VSAAPLLNLNPTQNAYMIAVDAPGRDPAQWDRVFASELQLLDHASGSEALVLCRLPRPTLRKAFSPTFVETRFWYVVVRVGFNLESGITTGECHRAAARMYRPHPGGQRREIVAVCRPKALMKLRGAIKRGKRRRTHLTESRWSSTMSAQALP
jgi:hypothetical protein